MNQKFDNGKILDVYTFPIEDGETVQTLIEKTKKFSVGTFKDFLRKLKRKTVNQMQKMTVEPSKFNWAREARAIKDIELMRKLDLHMSCEELSRRIKAFHFDEFPVYIEQNGFKFKYDGNI